MPGGVSVSSRNAGRRDPRLFEQGQRACGLTSLVQLWSARTEPDASLLLVAHGSRLTFVRLTRTPFRMLHRLYAFTGWGIVVLGCLHMVATLRLPTSSPIFRLWFFGSGMAMALVGALNLLHRAYGRSAIGVRAVCKLANALLTLFAAVAGVASGAGVAEYILIISLVGGALILSFLQAASSPHQPTSEPNDKGRRRS